VRSRLKRVFASAPQGASDVIWLSDTPEHARDLQWFLERYPMEVLDAEHLATQAQAHREVESKIADLLLNRGEVPHITLAKPSREYQEIAAQHLEVKGGLLLADDVGVGKTVSAICAMRNGENLPALVIVPAHLPRHWKEKLEEFAPDLRIHTIRKSSPYPLMKTGRGGYRDLWADRMPDVLICTYHKLRGWAETLAGVCRLVVFEECQQLRNNESAIYEACRHVALKARRRLGLSATPIYNYGSEFYWVIDALLPGELGTRTEFVREWCSGFTGKERINDTEKFAAYLRREGIMLRRTRKDVGRELPPVQKIPHMIDVDPNALDHLESAAVNLAKIVLAHNEVYRGQKMQAAGEFDVLMRQATGIAKAAYVAEFVRMLLESGESVVLFGWHREVYKIWLERLAEYQPLMYTGSESPLQKAEAERLFKSGERKLLIMSLRSGPGVDGLQYVCRTAVIGELDWSPAILHQCVGRLDRDGQPDFVTAYYMLSDTGSDPVMCEILGIKREQIEGVANPGTALIEQYEADSQHVKRLARDFLAKRGIEVPESENEEKEEKSAA